MIHDEAVAALESLPETARVEVARLKPGDVIVLEWPGVLSMEIVARLRTGIGEIWPNNKCLVLERGVKLRIVDSERAVEGTDA